MILRRQAPWLSTNFNSIHLQLLATEDKLLHISTGWKKGLCYPCPQETYNLTTLTRWYIGYIWQYMLGIELKASKFWPPKILAFTVPKMCEFGRIDKLQVLFSGWTSSLSTFYLLHEALVSLQHRDHQSLEPSLCFHSITPLLGLLSFSPGPNPVAICFFLS